MRKEKVIVILGQTATGKSALAVRIARRVGGEIISADSRQVYKGLDIGTGKMTKKEMLGIPHHLLDVSSPRRIFSVSEFQKLASTKIREIISRGNVPIIVGGTGLYIDAVTKGTIFPSVPPDYPLRQKLALRSDRSLLLELKKLDPTRANSVETKNKVRLIRAIEIARALGKVPATTEATPPYGFIKIGLYLPPEELKKKIEKRLVERIKQGMIHEVSQLHKKGLSWTRMQELGLEYRYTSLYLRGKLDKNELKDELVVKIYQYSKRQMTWFKRDKKVVWFDASDRRAPEMYIKLAYFK